MKSIIGSIVLALANQSGSISQPQKLEKDIYQTSELVSTFNQRQVEVQNPDERFPCPFLTARKPLRAHSPHPNLGMRNILEGRNGRTDPCRSINFRIAIVFEGCTHHTNIRESHDAPTQSSNLPSIPSFHVPNSCSLGLSAPLILGDVSCKLAEHRRA